MDRMDRIMNKSWGLCKKLSESEQEKRIRLHILKTQFF